MVFGFGIEGTNYFNVTSCDPVSANHAYFEVAKNKHRAKLKMR